MNENKNNVSVNKQKLKSYKKQLKSELFDIDSELVLSEQEDAQIHCKVGKVENIFSPYDIAKNRTITEAFHNYLMQETEIIPIRHNLELNLHIDNDTTIEQEEQIQKAIKRHYSFMITSANVRLKKTFWRAILLYLGGLITLLLNFFVGNLIEGLPLKETLLIISWFFVWEASGTLFFDRNTLKMRRYNMLRIYNAPVIFIKES